VLLAYNASATGGNKTLIEIQTKMKNLKSNCKKTLINNAKEMTKTGGGSASIQTNNDFNFSKKQISGLSNAFDSDSVDISDVTLIESNETTADLNNAIKKEQSGPFSSTPIHQVRVKLNFH
jgi:hypothetical protein